MPSFQLIRNRDNKEHSTEQLAAAAAAATSSSHKEQTQQNQSLPRRNKPPPPPGAPKDRLNIPSNLFRLDQQPKAESNDDTLSNDSTSSYHVQTVQQVFPSAVVVTPSKNGNQRSETTLPSAMATQSQSVITINAIPVDRNRITRVDGKGLWRSWKRNFNSQFTAILDLVDNSFDASVKHIAQNFRGICHIASDTYTSQTSNYDIVKTTGMTIINNCFTRPRPLRQCLEIYDSSKVDSGKDSVGENGVGLKQALATLSDVSFVLVKSLEGDEGGVKCKLGIVAERLQKAEGAYLPAFEFIIDASNNDNVISLLSQQMETIFSQPEHVEVAQCIAGYCGSLDDNDDNDSLKSGICRLCQHFHNLCTNQFADSSYVFAVIVDQIRSDNVEERSGVAGDALIKIHVDNLMEELRTKIPASYLHIPNSFEFRVEGERIDFGYWQKRLVEFSRFTIDVGTTIRFDDPRDETQTCPIRVFCGFDAKAMNDKKEKKCASLYLHSRQCGRLINHHIDARTLMGLNAGGTMFCSGLRVIIDDFDGHLPLNPTKQDIAFSEKSCGHIFRENLYAWVGAAVHMFYEFHKNKLRGRTELSKIIKEYGNKIASEDELQAELSCLDLTTFAITRKRVYKTHVGNMTLRIYGTESVGRDTLYRILSTPPSLPDVEPETEGPDEVPMESASVCSTEHVSKKMKLDETITMSAEFMCRSCKRTNVQGVQATNDTMSTSCIYCGTARPGSLIEEIAEAPDAGCSIEFKPIKHPAKPTEGTPKAFTIDLASEKNEQADNQLRIPDEEHYKLLCTKLTEKLEKQNMKLERRKKQFNEVVHKNTILEEEVKELKSTVASLEKRHASNYNTAGSINMKIH